jgi:methionine synthase II (cobalamin-independent)
MFRQLFLATNNCLWSGDRLRGIDMSNGSSHPVLPPALSTLAIGSVPYDKPDFALDLMAGCLDIPASPQLVQISPWEDMILGAISGIPGVLYNENQGVTIASEGLEEALALFYERYYAGDLEHFALDERSSLGFESFIKRAEADPAFGPKYLKSQVVGPLTLGQSVKDSEGRALVDRPDLLEAASLAIGAKAAWLAKRIRAVGREPIIFIDEPGLTGYGSAFSTLSRQMVVDSLGSAVKAAKEWGNALIGCHVCGNTDWGLLSGVGLDIMNFDAYAYLDTICLYPREIEAFLVENGALAFGVVPTRDFTSETKAADLAKIIRDGWAVLAGKGVQADLLAERTFITSACGLGSLEPEVATAILKILPKVSELLKN